jgi:hypothetical protein
MLRSRSAHAASVLVLFAASCARTAAQVEDDGVRTDWLERDLRRIAQVQALLPPAEISLATFRAGLESSDPRTDEPTGFAGRRLELAAYGGYTTLWINALVDDDGRFAALVIDCRGSRDSWSMIRDELRKAWSAPIEDVPDEALLRYTWRDPARVRTLERATAQVLGAPTAAEVPDALRAHVAVLTDPLDFHDFGASCYDDGAKPKGRVAIEALIGGQRFDLVRNALRGLNPTGRVYAAEALLARGSIDPADRGALRAVREITVTLSCWD